jgi:hypothetical protein
MRASYDVGLIRKFLEGLPSSKHEDLTHKFRSGDLFFWALLSPALNDGCFKRCGPMSSVSAHMPAVASHFHWSPSD